MPRNTPSPRDEAGAGLSEAPSRSAALTRRQREIFDYISGFVAEQGYSPSRPSSSTSSPE